MAGIRIEVVYATATAQDVVRLTLPPGARAGEAVEASGLLGRLGKGVAPALGIHGRKAAWDTELSDGDRVDLLRPLPQDPKAMRRLRARASRARRGG